MKIGLEKGEGNLRYFVLKGDDKDLKVRISLHVFNMENGPKKDYLMQGYLRKLLLKAKRNGVTISSSAPVLGQKKAC